MHFQHNALNKPLIAIETHYPQGIHEPLHQHTSHQLLIVQHGLVRVTTATGKFAITQQRGMWLSANDWHSLDIVKNSHIISLFIAPLARAELSNHSQVVGVNALLSALSERAIGVDSAYQSKDCPEAWLVELLLEECRQLSGLAFFELPTPTKTPYIKMCQKIEQNLNYAWTLADLAQEVSASERTVARQFLAQTGLSFVEWLRRSRLQHSLELLLQGQSVLEVANSVGYDSPSAFSTAFRQRLGLSPSDFMKQYHN